MNNTEQLTLPQSLTGARDITVDKVTLDSCGCCPNVVGKICVDGEIDVENICVQGNVSSDKVIAGVGAGKGFHLSTDPCNSEGDTVLSNDLTNTTLDGGSTPLVLTHHLPTVPQHSPAFCYSQSLWFNLPAVEG